jgi:hypothetical protein
MSKKLKVFGIVLMKPYTSALSGRQIRCVVAVTSQKAAAAAFKTTLGHVRDYGSITNNDKEVATAMSKPGVVFARALDDHHGNYIEIQL